MRLGDDVSSLGGIPSFLFTTLSPKTKRKLINTGKPRASVDGIYTLSHDHSGLILILSTTATSAYGEKKKNEKTLL